jgi:hypothetical protein
VVERDAEGAELRLVPAGAEGHHEPAARQLVDRRRGTGEHARLVERRARDERPEGDALSGAGQPGE